MYSREDSSADFRLAFILSSKCSVDPLFSSLDPSQTNQSAHCLDPAAPANSLAHSWPLGPILSRFARRRLPGSYGPCRPCWSRCGHNSSSGCGPPWSGPGSAPGPAAPARRRRTLIQALRQKRHYPFSSHVDGRSACSSAPGSPGALLLPLLRPKSVREVNNLCDLRNQSSALLYHSPF